MIVVCQIAYIAWGLFLDFVGLVPRKGQKRNKLLDYVAYPFSMTHILICLIGGVMRYMSWDPNLTWCQTYEDSFNEWDVLLILQSLCYFSTDMFLISRDPNYYVHHVMCIVGYVVVVFIYSVPLKITIIGMFFAEIGGFLLSLRSLDGEIIMRIFLILYGTTRVGMTFSYTSYCYCAGLFSGTIPDIPHLIFCSCGLAVTAQNWVWFNIQRKKYIEYYGPNGTKLHKKKST